MTDLEVMKRAKMYIDSLANGIDPLSGATLRDDDIVNNVRISRCLFYVSAVLQKVIDNGGAVQKKKLKRTERTEFSLTDEQISRLEPDSSSLSSAKITAAINAQVDASTMKKLKVTTLNDWLEYAGMLSTVTSENGRTRRIPTPQGELMGLSEKVFSDDKGVHKYVTYNRNAQRFIYDNIDAIIEFAHRESAAKKAAEQPDDTASQ